MRELDPNGLYALRLYNYNISLGHSRWLLNRMDQDGLSPQDIYDAWAGFRIRDALDLLDLNVGEFYALLLYFRFRVPAKQREYASRRKIGNEVRRFNEDGTIIE